MPLMNPVPGCNFFVFMANEGVVDNAASAATAALSGSISVAKDMITGTFSQIDGLEAELKIEDYEEGGLNTEVHRFASRAAYGKLTFRRGVTPSTDLWDWHYSILHGDSAVVRKCGLILLADRAGLIPGGSSLPTGLPLADKIPIAAWIFRGALPSKLTGPALNAKNNEIAIEAMELSHQGLERLGLAMIPGVGDALAAVGL
jgi:phage tail-like protein